MGVAYNSRTLRTHTTTWVLNVDGSTNAHKSGAFIILKTLDEAIIKQSLWFKFLVMNKEVEYEALIVRRKLA